MPRRIVAFAGPIASGKSTLAEALARQLDVPIRSFGGLVRDEADSRGMDHCRRTLQDLGAELHRTLGAAGMVERLLADVQLSSVIVDGVRHVDVHDSLLSCADAYLLVFVTASDEELTRRRQERERSESAAAAQHGTESQLDALRASASHVVRSDLTSVEESAAIIAGLARSDATRF